MDPSTVNIETSSFSKQGSGQVFTTPAECIAHIRAQYAATQRVSPGLVSEAVRGALGTAPRTMLPLAGLLTLHGRPYDPRDRFPFEPIFKLQMPRRMLWKCGRQVAKSTSLAAASVLRSACTPHLRTLFVTPRFDQVRRFSTNYVYPFIQHALIRPLLINSECPKGVLQRGFVNQSVLYFSFAFLDCERVRGYATDILVYDETQDIDIDFLPIIGESLSASRLGVTLFSGTPKTRDNGIETLWQSSSKAEWVTRCGCGYWNMACLEADLGKMIGLKTLVCAKCQKPLNARNGHWHHTDQRSFDKFHGYHVPQAILPMHYEDPQKWGELLDKRAGRNGYDPRKFVNEVLGESADVGVNLITSADLAAASTLPVNDFEQACRRIRRCKVRILGVDWGGGGEDEVSFTAGALVGLDASTGRLECHYAFKFHAGMTHDEEARELLRIYRGGVCQYFAHDYGGAGGVRETLMIQAGLPHDKILPFMYVRATTKPIVHYHSPLESEARGYYTVDKARALVLLMSCLKSKQVLLPELESSKYATFDLLNLMEDKHEMPRGSDIYLIRRRPKTSDDFAHALDFACLGIWHTEQRYPDLSVLRGLKLTKEQLRVVTTPPAPRYPADGETGYRDKL